MTNTINANAIDKDIENLQKEINKLKEKKRLLDNLPENKNLAIYLHLKTCRWNHTDGCSWYYGDDFKSNDWTQSTRLEYLLKAVELLNFRPQLDSNNFLTLNDCKKLIDILNI